MFYAYNPQSVAAQWNDLESAEHIVVDKPRYRDQVADDPVLLREFRGESKKYRRLPEYIRRYVETLP
ncbi:MAG: hypothetical protein AAFV53_42190 [Myxococcota bacterium]